MTPDTYRAYLQALGLTSSGAAAMFEISPRTTRRWERGDWPIPRSVAIALELMTRGGISPASLTSGGRDAQHPPGK